MRRSGRTTRIIDSLIQDYFIGGAFRLEDHEHDESRQDKVAKDIFRVVAHRLYREHDIKISWNDVKCSSTVDSISARYMYITPTSVLIERKKRISQH